MLLHYLVNVEDLQNANDLDSIHNELLSIFKQYFYELYAKIFTDYC